MAKSFEELSARFTRSPRGRGLVYLYVLIGFCVVFLFFRPHTNSLRLPTSLDLRKHGAYARENATFVTLVRNSDLYSILEAIQAVEDRFNHQYGYDWVFLNEQPFTMDFIRATTAATSGKSHYGLIPKEHWSFPEWIDLERAAQTREKMREDKVIYGDSISYRHMCRYESGFFFRHPLMHNYRYYWRVEPGIKLPCHIDYDLFKFMREEDKAYGFTISLKEYVTTIETLWATVRKWALVNAGDMDQDNSMSFVSDDNGQTYNLCHFWSNFEIGDLEFLRSEEYIRFFDFLDREGGFYYERWGDAPVHSIAASLLLPKSRIHFFDDVGYWHNPFWHCPNDESVRLQARCTCNPEENFDWNGYSCLKRFYETNGMQLPMAH